MHAIVELQAELENNQSVHTCTVCVHHFRRVAYSKSSILYFRGYIKFLVVQHCSCLFWLNYMYNYINYTYINRNYNAMKFPLKLLFASFTLLLNISFLNLGWSISWLCCLLLPPLVPPWVIILSTSSSMNCLGLAARYVSPLPAPAPSLWS